jgi:hypothetical protein
VFLKGAAADLLRNSRGKGRFQPARVDAVHTNSMRAQFRRERPGKSDESRFSGGVGCLSRGTREGGM